MEIWQINEYEGVLHLSRSLNDEDTLQVVAPSTGEPIFFFAELTTEGV